MENLNHIKAFFARFKHLTPPHESIKKAVQKSIKKTLHKDIQLENITVSRYTVFINKNSVFKNEVFLNKEKLLTLISKEVGNKITDIK